MRRLFIFSAFFLCSISPLLSQDQTAIRLLIRGDDIGSFHSANIACIESYQKGIMRSVEIMVPCPWYPEAVKMLNDNPGLDVGIHLVLTSEWENMKWRPLTGMSGITDSSGYFFPMVWENESFSASQAFRSSKWTLAEVERELRAQIELALSQVNSVSHLSTHMGFTSADTSIENLVIKLAEEYKLGYRYSNRFQRMEMVKPRSEKPRHIEKAFALSIQNLKPGTYLFVEHPATNSFEMETIGHKGYYGVGKQREGVTRMFTSKRVKRAIKRNEIELINYTQL